jgi:hypothetical protein
MNCVMLCTFVRLTHPPPPCVCPWLLLHRELLMQLLPPVLGAQPAAAAAAEPGSRLVTIADSHVGKLMRDECYSRVLEVVMAVAPADVFEEIYTRFLKGRLLPLTSHHSANFVVQSMFAACSTPQQVGELNGWTGCCWSCVCVWGGCTVRRMLCAGDKQEPP